MGRGNDRFCQRIDVLDPSAYVPAVGGLVVDWTLALSLGVVLFLGVYLCVALAIPERFS